LAYEKSIFSISLIVFIPILGVTQTNQKKLALIIGNAQYKYANPFKNPVNDARAMASSLRISDLK